MSLAWVACGPPFRPPPSSIHEVNGVIVDVDERSPAEQAAQGLRVSIQPDGSSVVQIDLAPAWYLDRKGLCLSQRERLTVVAMSASDGPVLRAQSVSNGIVEVPLRDANGRPYWDPVASHDSQ